MATVTEGPNFGGSSGYAGPSVPLKEMPREIGRTFKELGKAYLDVAIGVPLVAGFVIVEGTRLGYGKLRALLTPAQP